MIWQSHNFFVFSSLTATSPLWSSRPLPIYLACQCDNHCEPLSSCRSKLLFLCQCFDHSSQLPGCRRWRMLSLSSMGQFKLYTPPYWLILLQEFLVFPRPLMSQAASVAAFGVTLQGCNFEQQPSISGWCNRGVKK